MHDHTDAMKHLTEAQAALAKGDYTEGRACIGKAMASLKAKPPKAENLKLAGRLKQMRKP